MKSGYLFFEDLREYFVFLFIDGTIKKVVESEVLRVIKEPRDGDYFGNSPYKTMKYNK